MTGPLCCNISGLEFTFVFLGTWRCKTHGDFLLTVLAKTYQSVNVNYDIFHPKFNLCVKLYQLREGA